MSEPVVKLEPTVSDKERADAFKARLRAALAPVIVIMQEANDLGLILGWNIGRNQFGRQDILDIMVHRPL